MTRSNKKHAFAVGLFILIGIAIIVTGIFTVGNQEKFFTKKFIIKTSFRDVGGLQAGNNIWLSGVKVGTVKAIRFQGESEVEVSLNIDEAARSRIWKNSLARISTDGFIGNKIVIIYGGASEAGIVEDNDKLKSTKGISTDEIMGVLASNNDNLLEITSNLKDITTRIRSGKGILGALVYEKDWQQDLQLTLVHFRKAAARSESVMVALQGFTDQLASGRGLVHELITDTVVFRSLQASMLQLNEAITKASILMDTLNAAGSSLTARDKPAGMLLNDEAVARDVKEIITNLKAGSQKLDEDLKALQHNFLFRGYFRKREKGKLRDQ